MLPDLEDLPLFSLEAERLVNKLSPHYRSEYETLAVPEGADTLDNDEPHYCCYLGGYPRREQSGSNYWPYTTFLCQLDADEEAQIDFGDATVLVFYNPYTGDTEEIVNEW